ncbi:MAG TPA: phospholipase D family protein [Allosphingosinicella sp.]|jgi:YD repeat-containing protein
MDVEFLDAQAVRSRLRRYLEEYDEFHWAVAWGTHADFAQQLFAYRAKFRNVTFGVAFSQTDPAIVDALVGTANGYVATKFAGGTYHPKVYGFRSGRRVVAIVGSANFTGGGLGKNLEAAVALTGTVEDPALAAILAFARTSAGYGQRVTKPYADAYRASCIRAGRLPKPPRDPVPAGRIDASGRVVTIDWDEYDRRVRSSRHHDPTRSLELIAVVRRWFATETSFARFSPAQRKAVAGILGEYQKNGPDLDREWGWFGSMRGAGDFANRIEEKRPLTRQGTRWHPSERRGDAHAIQPILYAFPAGVRAIVADGRSAHRDSAAFDEAPRHLPLRLQTEHCCGFGGAGLRPYDSRSRQLLGAGSRTNQGVCLVQCGQARPSRRRAVGGPRGDARRAILSSLAGPFRA